MPVIGNLVPNPQPVTGTVTANPGTGSATLAEQQLQTTELVSIDAKIPALGQATMANSAPVVIASNQTAIPISGTNLSVTNTVRITPSATSKNAARGFTSGWIAGVTILYTVPSACEADVYVNNFGQSTSTGFLAFGDITGGLLWFGVRGGAGVTTMTNELFLCSPGAPTPTSGLVTLTTREIDATKPIKLTDSMVIAVYNPSAVQSIGWNMTVVERRISP